MAGRPRKPLEINKKHFSKVEKEQRKAEVLDIPTEEPFNDITPPAYLTAKQKKEFTEYADKLVKLNIFTTLDIDVLAQFCIAKSLYLEYSKQIRKILNKANSVRKWSVVDEIAESCEIAEDLKELLEKILRRERGDDVTVLMNLQDKAHKQCLSCAKELGLTITSRCKIVIPQPSEDDDNEL